MSLLQLLGGAAQLYVYLAQGVSVAAMMIPSRILVLVSALCTLAITAWFAQVPWWPIEISKMGNYGLSYWSFSIGNTVTAMLAWWSMRDVQTFESRLACVCLSALGIVSDAQFFIPHLAFAACFFVCAIWHAHLRSPGHWASRAALALYGTKILFAPVRFLFTGSLYLACRQVGALLQWATVACVLTAFTR